MAGTRKEIKKPSQVPQRKMKETLNPARITKERKQDLPKETLTHIGGCLILVETLEQFCGAVNQRRQTGVGRWGGEGGLGGGGGGDYFAQGNKRPNFRS
jgi:hypothetical protein